MRTITLSFAALGAFGVATMLAAPAQQRHFADTSGEPRFACSIVLSERTPEGSLPALARISAQTAAVAATAMVAGTVGKTSLENTNGCLVFSVDVKARDGRDRDVKVDAGTGRVVHVEQPSAGGTERKSSESGGEAENETENEAN